MTADDLLSVKLFSDNDWSSPVNGFKPERISVQKMSKVINAPIETGVKSIDNKVIDPIVIKLTGSVYPVELDGKNAMDDISRMFRNRKFEFYSIMTKESNYHNLILQDSPHDEVSEKYDLITYDLTFVEAMFIQGKTSGKADNDNSNFVNSGYGAPQGV